MKLGSSENSVVQNTFTTQSQSFKINACAQAFKILTDNLYEKKIPTIIRELSCNAWDSHIQAGNQDKKFDVFVPDMYEPNFYIRDYGTGLSRDDVFNIYTTYFQSTKNDSNDYIGAFGLGSKTPLCYTDQFMVTSWFQGYKHQFMVFMNDKGFPEIQEMGSVESDEPSGLKVEFAVELKDLSEFKWEILKFFQGAKLVPNILNNFEKEYIEAFSNHSEVIEKIEDIEILKKASKCYRNDLAYGNYARLGLVLYSFDYSIFKESVLNDCLNEGRYRLRICKELGLSVNEYCELIKKHNIGNYVIQFLKNISGIDGKYVVFNFKIGDLSVQASRERLSFDKQTTFAFNYFVLKHFVKIADKNEKELRKCKTLQDYLTLMATMKNFQFRIPQKRISNFAWMNNNFTNLELSPAKMLGYIRQRHKGEVPDNFIFKKYIRNQDPRSLRTYSEAKMKDHFVFNNIAYRLQTAEDGTKYLPSQLTIYVGTASHCNILNSEEELGSTFLYIKLNRKDDKEKIIEILRSDLPSFISVEEIPESLDYINEHKERTKLNDYDCRVVRKSPYSYDDSIVMHDYTLKESKITGADDDAFQPFESKKIYYTPFNKCGRELKIRTFKTLSCAKGVEAFFELKVDQVKWLNSLGIETINVLGEGFDLAKMQEMVEHRKLFYSVLYHDSKELIYEAKKIVGDDLKKEMTVFQERLKPFVRDLYYSDTSSGLGKRIKLWAYKKMENFIREEMPSAIIRQKLVRALIESKALNSDYHIREFYSGPLGGALMKIYESTINPEEEKEVVNNS